MNARQRLLAASLLKEAAISQAGGKSILRKLKARGVPIFRRPGFEGAPAGYWGATSFADRAKLTSGKWLDYVYIPRGVKTPLDDLAHEAGHIFQPAKLRPRNETHGRARLLSETSANETAAQMLTLPDRQPYLQSVAPDYRTYKVTESTTGPVQSAGSLTTQRFNRLIRQVQQTHPTLWKTWQAQNAQAIPFNKSIRRNLEKTDSSFARQYRSFMEQNRTLLQQPA